MRTRTELRQLVVQQFDPDSLITGTAETGGSTTSLVSAKLKRFPDDDLVGAWVYTLSQEAMITDSIQATGTVTFTPAIGTAPDNSSFEILPFAASEIHRALEHAAYELFLSGQLVRRHQLRYLASNSPIWNSTFDVWTDATSLTGWTIVAGSVSRRERSTSEYIPLGLNYAARLGASSILQLGAIYRPFLSDLAGSSVRLKALVRCFAANTAYARITGDGVSIGTTTHHPGDGEWAVISGNINIPPTTTQIGVELVTTATSWADFAGVWIEDGPPIYEYPFPHSLAPRGPIAIQAIAISSEQEAILSQRRAVMVEYDYFLYTSQSTGLSSQDIGVFRLRQAVPSAHMFLMSTAGPLNIPATDSDVMEVSAYDSLLLARLAAALLLERVSSSMTEVDRVRLLQRASMLRNQVEQMRAVAQQEGSVPLYPRW